MVWLLCVVGLLLLFDGVFVLRGYVCCDRLCVDVNCGGVRLSCQWVVSLLLGMCMLVCGVDVLWCGFACCSVWTRCDAYGVCYVVAALWCGACDVVSVMWCRCYVCGVVW